MNYSRIRKLHLLLLLMLISDWYVDCRKTSSSRKTSGYQSKAVPTRKSYTQSYAKPTSSSRLHTQPARTYTQGSSNYNSNFYNTPRKSSNVVTTPKYVVRTQPTVRHYPQQTQQSVYAQNKYTPRPVYTQAPAYPQQNYPKQSYPQQNYPKQSYPQQNYPTYQRPVYQQPSYSGNNYYSPGGFYKKKDHSVRNSVLAGLGGSALGLYLGYKLGGLTHSLNNPYGYGGYGGGYGTGMPQYSVVHHYHHGDRPIVQNAVVEPSVIAPSCDAKFCTPNTTPMCMTNGTIYCVAPISQTEVCNVNSTNLQCVKANITAPCLNATDENCNSTALATENLDIPCVTSINVVSAQNPQGAVTNEATNNKYCVTVIAEPFVEPKNLSNEEFARYVQENPQVKQEVDAKVGNIMNSIAGYMFL